MLSKSDIKLIQEFFNNSFADAYTKLRNANLEFKDEIVGEIKKLR